MLVIRLSRTGRKKQPYYRVVVAEKSAPIQGRFIEVLGHFNPRTKDLEIDVDRAKARVKDGAQPSETAEALLEKAGVLKREAITEKNRRPERKSKKAMKAEAEGGDAPAAAPSEGDAAPAADGDDAKSADSDQSDDSSGDDSGKDDTPADKPTDEAKADEKPEAKAEDTPKESKDSDKPNDDKGDSK